MQHYRAIRLWRTVNIIVCGIHAIKLFLFTLSRKRNQHHFSTLIK
ncbi:hypothetical protein JCM19297_691 [Nonlabens ulvanivorans]|nr:hypothetical protein JCM19297_691 [Nonlabens ulvanivorans]